MPRGLGRLDRRLEPCLDRAVADVFPTLSGLKFAVAASSFMLASGVGGKCVAVLDEAGALGYAIIKLHRRRVGLMGQPIDSRAVLPPGFGVNVLNQHSADAKSTLGFSDKEILEVAIVADRPAGPMTNEWTRPTAPSPFQAMAPDIGSAGSSSRDQVSADTSSGMLTR